MNSRDSIYLHLCRGKFEKKFLSRVLILDEIASQKIYNQEKFIHTKKKNNVYFMII